MKLAFESNMGTQKFPIFALLLIICSLKGTYSRPDPGLLGGVGNLLGTVLVGKTVAPPTGPVYKIGGEEINEEEYESCEEGEPGCMSVEVEGEEKEEKEKEKEKAPKSKPEASKPAEKEKEKGAPTAKPEAAKPNEPSEGATQAPSGEKKKKKRKKKKEPESDRKFYFPPSYCIQEGTFTHPKGVCEGYIVCSAPKVVPTQEDCPAGEFFDPFQKKCGKDVGKERCKICTEKEDGEEIKEKGKVHTCKKGHPFVGSLD